MNEPAKEELEEFERYKIEVQEAIGKDMLEQGMVWTGEEWKEIERCYDYIDNIKHNDISYIDYLKEKNMLKLSDLERIWKDVKEHEKISMEMAKKDNAEAKCAVEWDDTKLEFNKRLDNYKFYTDWEANEILSQMAGGGVEVPAEKSGDVKENGYSFNEIDILAECPKPEWMNDEKALEACKNEVEYTIGCKTEAVARENGVPQEVFMKCEISKTGREVPVVFHLKV